MKLPHLLFSLYRLALSRRRGRCGVCGAEARYAWLTVSPSWPPLFPRVARCCAACFDPARAIRTRGGRHRA